MLSLQSTFSYNNIKFPKDPFTKLLKAIILHKPRCKSEATVISYAHKSIKKRKIKIKTKEILLTKKKEQHMGNCCLTKHHPPCNSQSIKMLQ